MSHILYNTLQYFVWTEEGSQGMLSTTSCQYCGVTCNNIWAWSLWYCDGVYSSWSTWWLHSLLRCM